MSEESRLLDALARMAFMQRTLRVFPVTTPAAGADFSATVPGGFVWRPLAVTAKLVTSATVATRSVSLKITDQTNVLAQFAPFGTQAASLTATYSWANGAASAGTAAGGGVVTTGLPDMALPSGYQLASVTAAIDTTDQWSNVIVWVEEVNAEPRGVHELRTEARRDQLDAASAFAEGIAYR